MLALTALHFASTAAFVMEGRHRMVNSALHSSTLGGADDIARLQERARAVLEKSKAKLASKEKSNGAHSDDTDTQSSMPFFATQDTSRKRDGVIKSRDEKTGLITADGEKMAAMSEEEQWESRSLLEVFENEMDENEDVNSLASQELAKRDVAMSIFNLRKVLQTEDYKRIFDKRNRFIGEDN